MILILLIKFELYTSNNQQITTSAMQIQDFQNNRKYKSILPMMYITGWILMITGPLNFPKEFQIYCNICFAFLAFKSLLTLITCVIGSYRSWKLLGNYNVNKQRSQILTDEIISQVTGYQCLHAFIIPSYKQDISLLRSTLNHIASHQRSRQRYLVYLAMEEHQLDSDKKAQILVDEFQNQFKQIGFTRHQIKQHQQKGKASNVSWCVEHLQESFFDKESIDFKNVYLTIIDADSWVPQAYISNVDFHIKSKKDEDYDNIYTPYQMFTRNHLEVPILTRTYDQTHSMAHFSNIVSFFNAGFPLSNYTVSFSLMKKIGFWDTCADAIGQDFHTTLKAFWKTEGKIKTIPIYIPFNQVNVQTGQGYVKDMLARFWQAERHARGCADFAYCLKMLFSKKITFRTFLISYNSMECFILPAITPWAIVGSTFQSIITQFSSQAPELYDTMYGDILFKIFYYSFIACYFFYFLIKRKTNQVLYQQQNESLWRIVEFPLMVTPNIVFVSVPTFVIAAFKVFLNMNEYEVAKKKVTPN